MAGIFMRMQGIIYCVHLGGVGHLKRMLMLCEGLLKFADITLVQGGEEVGLTLNHPNFKHIKLPFIQEMKYPIETFKGPEVLDKCLKVMRMRKKVLFKNLNLITTYDFLISEQIPFTKLYWLNEVVSMIHLIKISNPKAYIISSHKGSSRPETNDLSIEQKTVFQASDLRTVSFLEKYYDQVFVHSDPQLIKLEDNFFEIDKIKDKVLYTGYISKYGKKIPPSERPKNRILISPGGGYKFHHYVYKILHCIGKLQEYHFTIIKGPMMDMRTIDALLLFQKEVSNLELIEFVDDLDQELIQCSLAIVMAGFTLINIYETETPALVIVNEGDGSQKIIGNKFSQHHFIQRIHLDDFEPDKLRLLIKNTIENPPKPDFELNINGIKNSIAHIVKEVMQRKHS